MFMVVSDNLEGMDMSGDVSNVMEEFCSGEIEKSGSGMFGRVSIGGIEDFCSGEIEKSGNVMFENVSRDDIEEFCSWEIEKSGNAMIEQVSIVVGISGAASLIEEVCSGSGVI